MRRTVASRLVALIVLLSAGLAAPVAALAHGVAHHHAEEERGHHGALISAQMAGPAVSDAHHEPDHQHPRLDGALRGRLDVFSLGLVPPPVAFVAREAIVLRSVGLAFHPVAPRTEHATGPPPRLRAPPHR